MRTSAFLAGTAALLSITSADFARADTSGDPTGVWLNDTGRGAVEIKPCGKAMCGHVVWLKDTADANGCGKQIIGEAVSVGGGRWDNGWIYSPEKKQNFDVELKPLPDGTLQVMGYAGIKLLSKTMIWTRAPQDIKRCGEQLAAVQPGSTGGNASEPKITLNPPAGAGPNEASARRTESSKATSPAEDQQAATAPGVTSPGDAKPATSAVEDHDKPSEAKSASSSASATKSVPGDGGEKPGQRNTKTGIKLGNVDVDKVFTKTPSGKCKVDLPWVKVQFDCD